MLTTLSKNQVSYILNDISSFDATLAFNRLVESDNIKPFKDSFTDGIFPYSVEHVARVNNQAAYKISISLPEIVLIFKLTTTRHGGVGLITSGILDYAFRLGSTPFDHIDINLIARACLWVESIIPSVYQIAEDPSSDACTEGYLH